MAWFFVFLCALLLFLRKPWALHTPQFWAEDGEIFMLQNEAIDFRAFWEPYNGYLHLLPRLIAWIASHTADVAWWPAIYNALAFALDVGVFARLASRRVALPAKPLLMLAFVVVAGAGDTLINVTNLQWMTAFYLLLPLFTARPTAPGQRIVDLAIVLVVGLNGPFAILFWPLFAWRAWKERDTHDLLLLGAITLCAAVQGWFVAHWRLTIEGGGQPFHPLMFFSILGSRLVTWPVFGRWAVDAWPLAVHAVLGVVAIGALFAWALRRDPRRPLRAQLIAAFVIVTGACVYRCRPDTWLADNLINGDRYFYIPRVLLGWLVILEIDATPRAIAFGARAVCAAAVLTHLPRFMIPAPRDYHWREHCDPIRRGVPANIYTLPEGWWLEYPGRPSSQ